MISTYIARAAQHAKYEILDTGRFYGCIPMLPGVWAEAETLERCREELIEVLEGWIVLSLRHGDNIPVIDGCDLNPVAEHA